MGAAVEGGEGKPPRPLLYGCLARSRNATTHPCAHTGHTPSMLQVEND